MQFNWECSLPHKVAGGGLRAHLSGNRVYVCGGDGIEGLNDQVNIFCLLRRKWITLIKTKVKFFGSAIVNGQLVIIGGINIATGEFTASLSTLVEDQWQEQLPPMSQERYSPCAITLSNRLVVAGGCHKYYNPITLVEVLNLDANEPAWQTVAPLPSPLTALAGVSCQGHFYVLGGRCIDPDAVFEVGAQRWVSTAYKCSENDLIQSTASSSPSPWKRIADIPCVGIAAVTLLNDVLVIGGKAANNESISKDIYCYICSTNEWKMIGEMPTPRYSSSAVVLPNLQLMVVGGRTDPKEPRSACDIVEIATLHVQ